ncbi:MAG: HisA/HisF-related TIM barrel protein [Methylovirgula sp.]|uniref:HisA/HisF-related TIM barrel protein n=1 Tax=Methylovirgula sp. TaxID=1978224 RepID=UPI0030762296
MDIIPVIDLKGGTVVRARAGARAHYAPIETPLAPTSRPRDIVAGFLTLHPFRKIYIADLDAITGVGDHATIVAELEDAFPEIEFWVDSGIATETQAANWIDQHRGALVIGSESLDESATRPQLRAESRRVLSLDFRGDVFQGPARLAADTSLWPQRIIVMTLAKVGTGSGPDFQRLGEIRAQAPKHEIYAAGGIRDGNDLRALAMAGTAGALVATALHDGKITKQHLSAHSPP